MSEVEVVMSVGLAGGKKCAKYSNSKFCTINQMTYIEQFLSQHIISYYLSALRRPQDHRLFVDYHNHPNFFSLTWEILLFGEDITKTGRKWLIELIGKHLRIAYDDLKDTALPHKQNDAEAIAYLKSSFQYVYVQMHQIMVRIILAHLLIAQSDTLTAEVDELAMEISYIYPALKAEISFNSTQINLTEWFQHYLTHLIKEKAMKPQFYRFLERVKNECHMIGPIERLFERLISSQDADDQKTREKQYESSVYEESRSQSMSKFSQDRLFNDLQLFRKKKKIIKDRYKIHTGAGGYATPLKKEECQPTLPETEKTQFWGFQQNNQSSQSQPQSFSSSAFSKLLKKYKKPMVRTIYHSSTKTFVPKRTIGVNGYTAEQYIQNLTASSSLTSSESLNPFEIGRKSSSKLAKSLFEAEETSQFCVPQTPKQEPLRKVSSQRGITEVKKAMPRLKI